MDSLQISTGEKRIPITRDGTHVGEIVFNPTDTLFAEKFYQLMAEFREKFAQYRAQAVALDKNTTKDENDLPANLGDRISLQKEICDYTKAKIDTLFGVGTSHMVFGDASELETLTQFFTGMIPFVQKARAQKVAQYITPKKPRRNGKHTR